MKKGQCSKSKLLCGVGDKDGALSVDSQGITLNSYRAWHGMINRCYNENSLNLYPGYRGCSVSEDWLKYSNFKVWFDLNYVKDYSLDKDLLVNGNKVYSPETCRYIPLALNSMFTGYGAKTKLPKGVNFKKGSNRFTARLTENGKRRSLGSFYTIEEATKVYLTAKKAYCKKEIDNYLADGIIKLDLYDAILEKIENLK